MENNDSALSTTESLTQDYDNFILGLQTWVNQGSPEEMRYEAARRISMIKEGMESDEPFILLNLSNLQLSGLPPQIAELTSLKVLNIQNNNLEELSQSIFDLRNLEILYANWNSLTQIPQSIENLTNLRELYVNSNNINSLPQAISSLSNLRILNISRNQISDILPLVSLSNLENLNISSNLISAVPEGIESLARLQTLHAHGNPIREILGLIFDLEREDSLQITLDYSLIDPIEAQTFADLFEDSNISTTPIVDGQLSSGNSVRSKIIEYDEEKRSEIINFLDQEGLDNFSDFLYQCGYTAGWQSHQQQMVQGLFNIIDKAIENPQLKGLYETIAEQSLTSCHDHVTLGFIQMQLLGNFAGIELEEMTTPQLHECARQELVKKFLTNKAEEKIAQLKVLGSRPDDIEVYLAYLQIGQELGLNLEATAMLYRRCSDVSDEELMSAKQDFLALDLNHEIAAEIYQNPWLKRHPSVLEKINRIIQEPRFSDEQEESEEEGTYLLRMNIYQSSFASEIIREIQEEITQVVTSNADLQNDNLQIPNAPLQTQNQVQEVEQVQVPQNYISVRESRPIFRRVIDSLGSCFGTGQG